VLRPGDPLPGLKRAERDEFERGRVVFERVFTPETGLGPLFNAVSCGECHEDPVVGGFGDEDELHAAQFLSPLALASGPEDTAPPGTGAAAAAACDLLFTQGGPVYQEQVTPALREALGIDREPVPPGAQTARRTAPDVFGFGLLDAVPDETILKRADPDDEDGDGISGRPNRFIDGRVGRFGRKGFVPTLAEFNAGAFQIEQGITVAEAPDEGTIGGQPIPPGVDPLPDPELDAESVRLADTFVRFLAPPPRRTPTGAAARGKRVFDRIGCAACHVPTLRTGPNDVRALSRRDVAAYTDLLLHDMGPELADICFGDATPSEFRTEPLMGLRFATRFMHDGRATTIDEAIRLPGGEAAASRDAFVALSDRDRAALIAFLSKL
jgi:CxxC motif-containing protein (DUF1111 family)